MIRPARRYVLAALLAVCAGAPLVHADSAAPAPRPDGAPDGTRSATPTVLVTVPAGASVPAGLRREAREWRRARGVRDVTWLTAADPQPPGETAGFAALLIVEFADEATLTRWQRSAARLDGIVSRRVDALVHGETPGSDPAPAAYEVNVYRVKTTPEEYRRYSQGYIVPLMEGQREAGLMGWYTMYLERPTSGPADAVLVKRYASPEALVAAAEFKPTLRAKLTAEHPTYPGYHAIKGTLRDDVSETVARWEPVR